MDSGISSAGHQQNQQAPLSNNTSNESSSPPPNTSLQTTADRHRELDELLSDMLLTVESIPDYKPANSTRQLQQWDTSQHQQQQHQHRQLVNSRSCEETLQSVIVTLDSVSFIDDNNLEEIPYHARQDSRPFTYGTLPPEGNMIGKQTGLASPSLVRKASFGAGNHNSNGYQWHDVLRRSNTEGMLGRKGGSVNGFSTSQRNGVSPSPYSDSESLSPPNGFGRSFSAVQSPEFHEK